MSFLFHKFKFESISTQKSTQRNQITGCEVLFTVHKYGFITNIFPKNSISHRSKFNWLQIIDKSKYINWAFSYFHISERLTKKYTLGISVSSHHEVFPISGDDRIRWRKKKAP